MSLLEVGQVIRPHGLRGEVVVSLVTTNLERLSPGSVLETSSKSAKRPSSPLRVVASRPFQQRFLVTFEGVASREAAELLRGLLLLAEPVEESDVELYVHQLIGKRVVDQHGAEHGAVLSLEANPASDLLVLEGGGLVPLRFVTQVTAEMISVEAPDGLFE